MEKQAILEKIALAFGVAVILGAIWFWTLQVEDVLELLRAAEGF
jgi:ABC-type uncharacterized transport system permease subunit